MLRLLASSVLAAQQAPVANGIILGRVIDAATKAPVVGVLVEIGARSASIPTSASRPQRRSHAE